MYSFLPATPHAVMKQRKIAMTLAFVGALASPFVFGTLKLRPVSQTWSPWTAEVKANIATEMERTNNCREPQGRGKPLSGDQNQRDHDQFVCNWLQERLNEGGSSSTYKSIPKFLALNALTVLAAFALIFGLSHLLLALVRRHIP
jgi:hypothetical protein